MKNSTICIVAAFVYIAMVALLVADYILYKDNESTMLIGMYALSSSMMLITMIFACLIYRNNASEKYKELYMEEKKDGDWEKRD